MVWGVLVSGPSTSTSRQPSCLLSGETIETDGKASLDLLSQLLRLTPSLEELSVLKNDLHDLPASFIDDLISHPMLRDFDPSCNHRLGCSHHSSTPYAIHRLLSEVYLAAFSSHFTMRDICVEDLGLTAECCGSALERLLSLGSRGPRKLILTYNPALLPL